MATYKTSYLSTFVTSARLVGVLGVGIVAGYDISLAHSALPSLLTSGLPADRLVIAWDIIYNKSEAVGAPILVAALIAFLESAYRASVRKAVIYTPLGLTSGTQLALASFSILLAVPHTLFSVAPVVWRLKTAGKNVEEATAKGGMTYVDAVGIREDVDAFRKRTAVRAGLFTTAFVLGLTAF
ncbi:hypothetical protein FS837_000954 [Tulasnella sp. UAMH 9824]|nr:hypothetical protein FS837_000954 [Tulasnella sp. UAMH 9824]